MQTGHIYIQFTKPVTGNIVVEKTVMGLDNLTDGQKAELSDALNKEYQMTATSADKEVEQTATAALVLDEETGGYKFTATFEDLSTEHGTYTVTVDGEDELKAALEDVGLFQQSYTVSGGEDIDLANYYQLTRNADGTVNTSGLIDEDTVPTVTVTSTYGTEKPVAPTVTLTYDPNGGDGPDKEFTQDLVDGKAEFTVIENPFTRDEVNGITYSFTGWNTRADGTGTDYAPDSTITLTEDETLYAQWKAEGEEPPVETSDTVLSKTLSGNLDENGETNVTLSVPSDGYKQTVDVVLAVDCTSVLEHYGDAIIENIGTLGDELLEEDVNLSVGVVAFGRESKVVHELTALNQGNSEHWASDIAADIWENQDWYLSNEGTNIQGGIRMAQDVLNRSTSGADANHKYIVLITDGGAYWYCRSDTDDTPVNTAHKGDKLQSMGNMDANGDVGSHQNDSAYLRHVEAGGDFASFMEQYGTQIEESAAGKAFSLEETMAAQEAGSATEDPALKEVWDNAFTTEQVNDPSAYPFLNMERGTYFAAQELLNAKEQGTHIVTIGYPYTAGTFLESLRTVSADFREWTGTVGDYYDGNNLGNAFSDLADQITYFVDAGSYVIDQMGSGEDEGWKYNFDFINDAQYLKLTVGGETLKVADLGNNSYGFAIPPAVRMGKLPFVLTYTPEQDGKNDSFQLDINVPVLASEPVQLTYRVKQVNEEDGNTHGQYDPDGSQENNGLLTNNSAVLHPKDGPAMEFPKPTVSVGAIRIQPADITIYTGGDGYESVVTGSGNDLGGTNNGLPEPGFYITLPAEVNEWLLKNANEKDIVINDQGHEVVDLSEYLTFAYDDGKGTTRTWELERYDTNDNDNNSMAYEKFIYRIKPAVVNDEEIPIRLQFTNEDGSYTNSDDFTVSLDQLYQDYEMTIYAGDLNQGLVKAVLTVGNEKKEFSSAVDTGLLKIRGVNDEDPINEVNTGAPTSEVNEITAYVPEDANFYINSSKLEVANPDDVALLVDSIVPDENNTLYHSAVDKFAEITSSQNYQLQYMDLVDTSNGNAYVTTDKAVDIYWPYPEGTDRNTEFYVVHYQGMDREDEGALGSGSYEDEMVLYSEDNGKLETTDHGIKFTVESFSPFALFWGESGDPDWPPVDPDPDPDPDPNPDPDPGDKPELNTEDHYAYIVGYPDGNVKPEGNITRAEVATIFFRLLTDESRDEF
ncbi:MAG: InlB B-repeat-containing protein, partial [Evtepia sp.]